MNSVEHPPTVNAYVSNTKFPPQTRSVSTSGAGLVGQMQAAEDEVNAVVPVKGVSGDAMDKQAQQQQDRGAGSEDSTVPTPSAPATSSSLPSATEAVITKYVGEGAPAEGAAGAAEVEVNDTLNAFRSIEEISVDPTTNDLLVKVPSEQVGR